MNAGANYPFMNRPTTKGYTPTVIELACNAMVTAARAKAGCGSAELLILQHPACWPAVGAEDRPMAEVARVWSSFDRSFDGPDEPVCELPLHTSRRPALGA